MIGLDTHVLVRYIMQDDAKQSPKATALIESLDSEHPGFITVVSVVEESVALQAAGVPRQVNQQAIGQLPGVSASGLMSTQDLPLQEQFITNVLAQVGRFVGPITVQKITLVPSRLTHGLRGESDAGP